MKHKHLLVILLAIVSISARVSGFVRLVDPPQRSSLWRYGFHGAPVNYKDGELNCGGFEYHWHQQEGCCGLCGDPCNGPREHEEGGKYARGIIAGNYVTGRSMKVKVDLWPSQQLGYFEFRLCSRTSPWTRLTQECLDENVLLVKDVNDRQFYPGSVNGTVTLTLRLPASVTCEHCVLQLKYNTGYRHGDEDCPFRGCGQQEQFYNCADVRIEETPSQQSTNTSSANPHTQQGSLGTLTNSHAVTEELPIVSGSSHVTSSEPSTAYVSDATMSTPTSEHHDFTTSSTHKAGVPVPMTESTQTSDMNSSQKRHNADMWTAISQPDTKHQGSDNRRHNVTDATTTITYTSELGHGKESVPRATSGMENSSAVGAATSSGRSSHIVTSSVNPKLQAGPTSSTIGFSETYYKSPALVQYPSKLIAASATHLSELGLNVNGRFEYPTIRSPYNRTVSKSDGALSIMWTRLREGPSLAGYRVPVFDATGTSNSVHIKEEGPVPPHADADTRSASEQVTLSSPLPEMSNGSINEQVVSDTSTQQEQSSFSTNQETVLPLATFDPRSTSRRNDPLPSSSLEVSNTNVNQQASTSSTSKQGTMVPLGDARPTQGNYLPIPSSMPEIVNKKVLSGISPLKHSQGNSPNKDRTQSVSMMFEATGHSTGENVLEGQNATNEFMPVTTVLNLTLSKDTERGVSPSTSPAPTEEATSPSAASLSMEVATRQTPKSSSKRQEGLTKTMGRNSILVSNEKVTENANSASGASLSSVVAVDSLTKGQVPLDTNSTSKTSIPSSLNDTVQEAAEAFVGTPTTLSANTAARASTTRQPPAISTTATSSLTAAATTSTMTPAISSTAAMTLPTSSATEPVELIMPIDRSIQCTPSSPEFRCHSKFATENWCIENCKMGFCPLMFCRCSCSPDSGFHVQRPAGPKCVSIIMPKYDLWCDAFHSTSRFCHPRYCKISQP